MWVRSSELNQVISDSWAVESDFLSNLESCRLGLINWNRNSFGQVKDKVKKFKKI